MLWNRQDFRKRPDTYRRDPSEIARTVSQDIKDFVAKGGKIKLIPLSMAHKNVLTQEYRREEAERLELNSLSGGYS